MKRTVFIMIVLTISACLLFGSSQEPSGYIPLEETWDKGESATSESTPETTELEPETTEPVSDTTEPAVPETEPPETEHSELYDPNVSVERVIEYFNEVCLNAEYVNSGDPTKLQKWATPIKYICHGTPTDKDRDVLCSFAEWLNTIEGFPGISETTDPIAANVNIYFFQQDEYLSIMGEQFEGSDGGVTFWYNGADQITDAIIGYRTDIDQKTRNSVILEEIYNCLGPINDTVLRTDSIIYSGFSIPQGLTAVDELVLKLLYHPSMKCSMNADECASVIRQIYY